MLTITSGAKSHLEGAITKVTYEIQINWSGSTWTNETTYLHSVNVQKRIEDRHLGPVANTFNVVVDNTTGHFSWPSESTRTPKKKIRIYADINGEDVLVLTGVIDTIEQRRDGTALLKGRDLSAIAIDAPAPQKTYVNQSPEDIIDDLWTEATGYSTSSDATGIIMDFMNFKRESSVWAAISNVCKKTVGRVNVLPDGTLKYESLIGKNYTPKSTADWNCATDDFDSISEQLSTKDIINAVIVSYKNKQVDEDKAAYMLLSDPEGNSVQQDEDERLVNWTIGEILAERHRASSGGVIYLKRGHISSIVSVMNDTTETDISAHCSITDATSGKVTLSSGFSEGDEIRFRYKVSQMKLAINYGYTPAEGWTFEGEVANPTLDYEFGTGSATITLDDDPDPLLYPDADAVISISSISSGATLTKLWITGDVAVARVEKFKKFDNTSITVFGRRELQLELEGVSIDDARKVAQRIVDRYKDPGSTSGLSITMHPELDILDVINVADSIHTNLDMKYEIESLNISYANGESKCSVQLRQHDTVAWTYSDNGITVTAPWDVKKPLTTPVFTNVAVTQNSIAVSWERQFSAINHMLVLKEGAATLQTVYTTGNGYTFGSLDADTEHTIELTVIGRDGTTAGNSTTATTLSEVAIGDGLAPAVPSGLSLSAFYKNGKSYIKADWSDNSEEDLMGYELRWNYDNGATWYNAGFTSQSELVIEVTGNGDATYTVYAQVRARDIEKLQSDWSSSANATVQKDSSAPSAPSSVSVVSGVGMIYVYWDRVSAIDLDYYQLERCVQTSNGGAFSAYAAIATLKSTDYIDENLDYHIQNDPEDDEYANQWRKYKYRVKAVDLSGNSSSYSESSSSYASQATGADIAVDSVKANHIEAAFKIMAGKSIQAGTDNDHYRMTNEGFFRKKFSEAMIETMVLTCTLTGITDCDDCSKFYLQYQYSEDGGTTWNGDWLAPSFYFGIENGCFWTGFPTYVYKADGTTQTLYMPLYGYNLAGVSLNDFRIRFKLYTESGSRYIKVSEFGCIINGERLTLNSLSDFESYEDASSVNVFAYELNDVPYIKAFSGSSPWTYIMNAGLALEEEDLDIDLAIPSILKTGTVFFDGTQESIVVAHGIPIDKSAYEILLFPEYYQYLDYGFDYSNKNYRMVMTARKPEGTEKYFNLDFYAIELTSAGETQHRDTEWLTSSLATVFVGDDMKRVSFDVYHWGLFNFHQGSYYHEYETAGDYDVQIKQSSGEIYVDWDEGDGEEYLCDVFGAARLRNVVEKREVTETVKKLSGNIRWLMIQTQPWG